MISRRLAALTLSLLAFAGCHEDPTVEAILVQPSVQALGLFAAGGNASSALGMDGVGGLGGNFKVTTNGLISLGSPSFVPSAPAVPAAPSTFEYVVVAGEASITKVGSIQITGSITTSTTTPVVITSSDGDIVVDGTLQSGDTGSAQSEIQLVAPKGTVYVSGLIRTAGLDSALNGRAGGKLTIDARRVVITGTIDTHGVANTTVAAANGGNGGDVDIKASQSAITVTAGSIVTSGGAAVDTTSSVPVLKGGNGGFVHLNSAAPVNSVSLFAPVTTDGGAMTGNGTTPTGGLAGSVVIQGAGEVDIVATVSMQGGAATGTNTDGVGGAGGTLAVDGPAVCKLYGSVLAGGGTAVAAVTGSLATNLVGGAGGSILLGQTSRLNSVELGSGDFNQAGGTGGRSAAIGGGQGGAVAIESFDGDITIGSSIRASGGAATGVGNTSGGAAGSILVRTDAQSGVSLSTHILSIASLASLLDASGGAALGTGSGGLGGTVLLQSGGDLTCGAQVLASGGSSISGTGGNATPAAILIQVTAAGALVATGDLNVTGTIEAMGGLVSVGGTGGNGSNIAIQVLEGNGSLNSSATINSSGSNGGVGAGGDSGALLLASMGGDLNLSGTLTANGSSSPVTPKVAGNITIQSGGPLQSSAAINAIGGASTDATGGVSGRKGGAILFNGTGVLSSVTLVGGSTILADGGTAFGNVPTTLGGAGGSVTLQTVGRAIDMSGALLVRGGNASGTGTGGLGGQVIAVSAGPGGPVAGNITLEAGSSIDVSGGSGAILGASQQCIPSGDPGTALTLPMSIAILFDANGGTSGAAGTTVGRITNAGSITATGTFGGDIYYNGLNSLGGTLTLPADSIGVNFSGATAGNTGHFFVH